MNFARLIEEKIRKAQEQGKFRNLRGEGKPQHFEDNPFENPEMRVPYKIMSNAGMCPPWMELMKEIDAELAQAARALEDYRAYRRMQMESIHRGSVQAFAELVAELDHARDRNLERLTKRWREINKKVHHFNAIVPIESLQKLPVDVERKREQFEREFPLLGGVLSPR